MQPQEAAQAFDELQALRAETRTRLRDLWFPLAVFGTLMLASVPLIVTFGRPSLAPYWIIAAPLGAMAVSHYYRRQAMRVGLEGPYAPYAAVGIGIFVGSMLTGSLGGALGAEVVAVAGPPLVISAGLVAFGWLDRSVGEAVLAVALAIFTLSLVVSAIELERVSILVTLTYGAMWLGAGLFYRRRQH